MSVYKRFACLTIVLIMLHPSLVVQSETHLTHAGSNEKLTSQESKIIALINGTRIYDYDSELEQIALRHNAFRVAGSIGATESAQWLKEQFDSFGLQTWLEPFEFTTWDLLSKPSLSIDDDGNQSTTSDRIDISSFQCEHLSWPTPQNGTFADLVILPLPEAANRSQIDANKNPINMTAWNAIDTTGKIVLVGAEVRWDPVWTKTFLNKIESQTPKALVSTWWYNWMSFTPPMFDSINGRAHWPDQVPAGFIDHQDGLWIREREHAMNVSAYASVDSNIGNGVHNNVVARIEGYENPEKIVIISSHYDTVMCTGFADNGAGTAAVVELARVFKEAVEKGLYKPSCTLLFVAFAGEDLWMVGSTNYLMQHKNEIADIKAVINLDSIGNHELCVTVTEPVDGFDLDKAILKAAQDLGINATSESLSGADHGTFLNPRVAELLYYSVWGLIANVSDVEPVKSSVTLVSYPILYADKFSEGTPGWIHTRYDNSTSTQTLNWVKPENLKDHTKVAALSAMRVSPPSRTVEPLFFNWLALGVVATIIVIAIVVVQFFKIKKPPSKDLAEEHVNTP